MTLKEIVQKYREENDLSQREFAARCGLSNAAISIIEGDKVNPKTGKKTVTSIETCIKLAQGMGMTPGTLIEMLDNDIPLRLDMPNMKIGQPAMEVLDARIKRSLPDNIMPISSMGTHKVPLIGSVAAGQPILATESYDVYIDSPAKADYALRVEGDSMEPTYLDGDVVYIRQVDDVDDGTVAVVLVEDEACLKRVYHIKNGLSLVSENPKYPPMIRQIPVYDSIRILGVVVGYTRMYKA